MPNPRRKKTLSPTGKVLVTLSSVAFFLLLATFLAALFIAEPWVDDRPIDYVPPVVTDMGEFPLGIGQEYFFELRLGPNEIITSVESEHPDIIAPLGGSVRAEGTFVPVKVTVTTREATLPEITKQMVFFGKDYSVYYSNLRMMLRAFFGVSELRTLPTELRVLEIYEYTFVPGEYPLIEHEEPVSAPAQTTRILTADYIGNYDSQIYIEDPAILYAAYLRPGNYLLTAVNPGQTQATILCGFYKEVDDETYRRYIDAGGQTSPGRPGTVFVPCYGERFIIEITPAAETGR